MFEIGDRVDKLVVKSVPLIKLSVEGRAQRKRKAVLHISREPEEPRYTRTTVEKNLLMCTRVSADPLSTPAASVKHKVDVIPAAVKVVVTTFERVAGQRDRVAATGPLVAGEIRLDQLEFTARRERPLVRPSDFPAVTRDINLVVAEDVPWSRIEAAIRGAAGAMLEACTVSQVWQDAERLGAGRKSVVVSLVLRSGSGTLSGDEAARVVAGVVEACRRDVQAEMR